MENLIHRLHFSNLTALNHWLPALPYIGIMLALIVSFALFLSLKTELRHTTKRVRTSADRETKRVNRALAHLAKVAAATPPPVQMPEPLYLPVAAPAGFPVTGFNINRRVQALRMLRRGEDTAHIAAALAVSLREVELLIRMQQIVSQAAHAPQNQTAAEPTESIMTIADQTADPQEIPAIVAPVMQIEAPKQTTPDAVVDNQPVETEPVQPLMTLKLPTIRRSSAPPTVSKTQGLMRRRTVAVLA